jgi:hypothetical protein
VPSPRVRASAAALFAQEGAAVKGRMYIL